MLPYVSNVKHVRKLYHHRVLEAHQKMEINRTTAVTKTLASITKFVPPHLSRKSQENKLKAAAVGQKAPRESIYVSNLEHKIALRRELGTGL